MRTQDQFALELLAGRRPPHDRFPVNHLGSTLKKLVRSDLLGSREPTLIVGYASLDGVIDLLAACYPGLLTESIERIRILFGNEPFLPRKRERKSRRVELPREIADYWLDERFSVYLCADVIAAREALKTRRVEVRTASRRPIHAKIYQGDNAITMGSSNFTPAGLGSQIEANARWTDDEPVRLNEAKELASSIWDQGQDYIKELDELLERLLRPVKWQEALARACAEILEGEWARRYAELTLSNAHSELWPSQEIGVAEALWVLATSGSVLIADATGSGKTRTGTHLMRAIQLLRWHSGRVQSDFPVLVCPPHVADQWQREAAEAGRALHICSQGVLSHSEGRRHRDAMKAIRAAEILAVDEAHNFFNRKTGRTYRLFSHGADHVVLFTATPINKGPQDLLAVIDLLGADNLEDDVLRVVDRLWRNWHRHRREPAGSDLDIIRHALRRFIVRRTKKELNRLVDREPDRYKNALGDRCRFPEQESHTYATGESANDRELALQIREVAATLLGLTHLRTALHLSSEERLRGTTEDEYLRMRLRAARALAAYQVAVALRSSRAALYEHLLGTKAAQDRFSIPGQVKGTPTGDVIGRLAEIAVTPPASELQVPLPAWLQEPDTHKAACGQEIEKYKRIRDLLQQLTGNRERSKATHLIELLTNHPVVIGFDRYLITLHALRSEIASLGHTKIVLGTGTSGRQQVADLLALDSESTGVITLCSEAMSEGMNLQRASAVVHLDLPSVIRVVEQRIGRVDRMDSPHRRIQVWWPDDSDEFALRSDERLIERHFDVHTLLGSNMRLPDNFRSSKSVRLVRGADLARELEQEEKRRERTWQGMPDALQPVRSLVVGKSAVIPQDLYESMRSSKARIRTAVSVVGSTDAAWTFLAIEGTDRGAPRWVFLPTPLAPPMTDIQDVSAALRARLSPNPEDLGFDGRAADQWQAAVRHVAAHEVLLLPRKQQRILKEMRHVLLAYRRSALRMSDTRRLEVIESVLQGLGRNGVGGSKNLGTLAEWWMQKIKPIWIRHLSKRRRKPAMLSEIRQEVVAAEIETETIETYYGLDVSARPLDHRIVVAIIGLVQRDAKGAGDLT